MHDRWGQLACFGRSKLRRLSEPEHRSAEAPASWMAFRALETKPPHCRLNSDHKPPMSSAAQIFVMAPQVSSSMNPCRHRLDIRSYMLKSPKGFSGVVARCCCISLFSRRAAHDSTANNDLLTKPPWIEQDQAATVTPKARTRCTLQGKEGF